MKSAFTWMREGERESKNPVRCLDLKSFGYMDEREKPSDDLPNQD